jgi:hypothetical protein
MSYELNLSAERSRKTLQKTILGLCGMLLLVLAAILYFGITLLKRTGHAEPSPQPIAIYAMAHAGSAENHWRVLCFRRSPEYAFGRSQQCSKDATACEGGRWTTAGTDGTSLEEFLREAPAPHIELALMVGGHDDAPVIPNKAFASNADLALLRADHAASTTLPPLPLESIAVGRVASANVTTVCGDHAVKDTPEQRRTPVLVLVVNDSVSRQEHAP